MVARQQNLMTNEVSRMPISADARLAKNMLVFGMDEHNGVKSPGVERASTPVEHKATATEPSRSVASLCGEAGTGRWR